MRQRKVKNLDEKLYSLKEFSVESPTKHKGKWNLVFGNDNPIYLEIGSGRGQFLSAHAIKYPQANYIGIEGQPSVVLRALEKAADLSSKADRSNLRFICMFVEDIGEIFEKGELAGIFLNFSDPWPKARHNKRRLTYRGRLQSYANILGEGGSIQFKTDNDPLFDFTLEEIEACGFEILEITRNLHGVLADENLCYSVNKENIELKVNTSKTSDLMVNMTVPKPEFAKSDAVNITTEYEDKFKEAGKNINYVRIRA